MRIALLVAVLILSVAGTAAAGTAAAHPAEAVSAGGAPPRWTVRGHGERILLIDDEMEVREAVRGVLESAGYQVVSAEDGVQGVRLLRKEATGIEAVITDMVMPHMNGAETIAKLLQVDPHVRIIATSGVVERSEAAASGARAFVPKPVELGQLLRVVAETLAQPA